MNATDMLESQELFTNYFVFPLNFHNLNSIFSFLGRMQDFLKIFCFCKYFSESNTISKNLTELLIKIQDLEMVC